MKIELETCDMYECDIFYPICGWMLKFGAPPYYFISPLLALCKKWKKKPCRLVFATIMQCHGCSMHIENRLSHRLFLLHIHVNVLPPTCSHWQLVMQMLLFICHSSQNIMLDHNLSLKKSMVLLQFPIFDHLSKCMYLQGRFQQWIGEFFHVQK